MGMGHDPFHHALLDNPMLGGERGHRLFDGIMELLSIDVKESEYEWEYGNG